MKLCLGTVQFGLDYGINNSKGKIAEDEVVRILEFAYNHGIVILDTARGYGGSESALGRSFKKVDKEFKIITKYSAENMVTPVSSIDLSLQSLGVGHVYGYLFHKYSVFQDNPDLINDFIKIKEQGKTGKIGFSLYYPLEAEYILKNNIPCDIVQVPYNIFDQRFAYLFSDLKSKNIDIYVRSIFLQGLFFINPDKLDPYFYPVRELLKKLYKIATIYSIDISTLCLGFVNANKNIDKIVVGVDSLDDLQSNIENYSALEKSNISYHLLESFSIADECIILPFNWKKKR
jgi:aryl-alcohol dehydrogenase-like predicted oxidoreductase